MLLDDFRHASSSFLSSSASFLGPSSWHFSEATTQELLRLAAATGSEQRSWTLYKLLSLGKRWRNADFGLLVWRDQSFSRSSGFPSYPLSVDRGIPGPTLPSLTSQRGRRPSFSGPYSPASRPGGGGLYPSTEEMTAYGPPNGVGGGQGAPLSGSYMNAQRPAYTSPTSLQQYELGRSRKGSERSFAQPQSSSLTLPPLASVIGARSPALDSSTAPRQPLPSLSGFYPTSAVLSPRRLRFRASRLSTDVSDA